MHITDNEVYFDRLLDTESVRHHLLYVVASLAKDKDISYTIYLTMSEELGEDVYV